MNNNKQREEMIEAAQVWYFKNARHQDIDHYEQLADFALEQLEAQSPQAPECECSAEIERLRNGLAHIRDMPVYDQDDHVRMRHRAKMILETPEVETREGK